MDFRDLVADMDEVLVTDLGDIATVNGREIEGFLEVPWLEPKFGKLNTGLREPHFVIPVVDAQGVAAGQVVIVDMPAQDGGGTYDLVKLEPDGTGWVALVLRLKA